MLLLTGVGAIHRSFFKDFRKYREVRFLHDYLKVLCWRGSSAPSGHRNHREQPELFIQVTEVLWQRAKAGSPKKQRASAGCQGDLTALGDTQFLEHFAKILHKGPKHRIKPSNNSSQLFSCSAADLRKKKTVSDDIPLYFGWGRLHVEVSAPPKAH